MSSCMALEGRQWACHVGASCTAQCALFAVPVRAVPTLKRNVVRRARTATLVGSNLSSTGWGWGCPHFAQPPPFRFRFPALPLLLLLGALPVCCTRGMPAASMAWSMTGDNSSISAYVFCSTRWPLGTPPTPAERWGSCFDAEKWRQAAFQASKAATRPPHPAAGPRAWGAAGTLESPACKGGGAARQPAGGVHQEGRKPDPGHA